MLENISDTALWVAHYRALETERADHFFSDRLASRLSGERGEKIARQLRGTRHVAWSIAVRTRVLDELILYAVDRCGVDTVVNLAAGLDTRPYRLPLPPSTRWLEADLPALLDYKDELIGAEKANCRLERVRADLSNGEARRAVLDQVASTSERAIVLTEGLLYYLAESDVAALATELAARPAFRFWAADLFSRRLLRYAQLSPVGHTLARAGAGLHFAPEGGPDYFARFGWKTRDARSMLLEGRRLGRPAPLDWLLRTAGAVAPRFVHRRAEEMCTLVLLEKEKQ